MFVTFVTFRQLPLSPETRLRLGTKITKHTKIAKASLVFFVLFVTFVGFVPEPSARLSQAGLAL